MSNKKRSPTARRSIRSAQIGSYAVFAILLVSAALVIRALFSHDIDAALGQDVKIALDQAEDAVENVRGTPNIVAALSSQLTSSDEGLEWFDTRGKRIAALGLMEGRAANPIRDSTTNLPHGRTGYQAIRSVEEPPGIVRATISDGRSALQRRRLDTDLGIGLIFVLAIGALSGSLFAGRAVDRVEYTLERARDFTADAAHELRAPLMAITSNTEAIVGRGAGPDDQHLTNISLAAHQMVEMINDLLLLARSEEAFDDEFHAVDISKCIDELARSFESEANARHISLKVQPAAVSTVYGNPDQIRRIIENLVRNAFRYTPDRGAIRITQSGDASSVIVAVTDSGIGIEPDALDKIFERFWRADAARNTEGTGLGLPIARSLARRHGGDIDVQSALGQGSTFRLVLPRQPVTQRLF